MFCFSFRCRGCVLKSALTFHSEVRNIELFSDRFSQQGYSMSQFICICPALHVVYTDLNIDVDFKVKFLRIAPLKRTEVINLI